MFLRSFLSMSTVLHVHIVSRFPHKCQNVSKPPVDISCSRFSFKIFWPALAHPNYYCCLRQPHCKQLPLIVWTRSPVKDSEWALTQVRVGISREFQTSQTMTVLWERGFLGEFLTRLLPPAAALLLVFTATWFGGYHFFFFLWNCRWERRKDENRASYNTMRQFFYWDSAVCLKLFFRLLQFFGLFSEFWKGCFW